jgi:putative chitinase
MSLDITDAIQDLWPSCPVPLLQGIIDTSDDVFAKFEFAGNRLRILHAMVQFSAETGGGSPRELQEDMSYSAARMRAVWPRRFKAMSDEDLAPLAHNPEALADSVYGTRMGNCQPGDGFRFRGQGLSQLTGRDNYAKLSAIVGIDLIAHPEALLDPSTALLCGVGDFVMCGCVPYADQDDVLAVSGCLNVGHPSVTEAEVVGWQDRQQLYRIWAGRLS